MKRILLIKLTSLGDLIHALPALSDAKANRPDIAFDWVVDGQFQEVARWHPAVANIHIAHHRAWRKTFYLPRTWKAVSQLVKTLRQTDYDLVIDGQGNFKTALLSLSMNSATAGFDRNSVREWIAHFAYQQKYAASRNSHAIDRLRRLFASALHYPLPLSAPDFQIDRDRFLKPEVPLPKEYLVFIHSAAWTTKLWPESHWAELIRLCAADGFSILLPWGSPPEKERAHRLAIHPAVRVLPKLSLSEIGYILAHAKGCVAMDTGLSHLAGALHVPCITLYGATNAGRIGALGDKQIHISSTRGCSPCEKKQCRYSSSENPCMREITPVRVYNELLRQASLRYL